MSKLASRITKVKPSSTLQITARAKELKALGKDVVNLAAGEPDFDTPGFVKEAAISAINEGFTKYTPTSGILPLKKAISEKFKSENNLNYNPEQIIISCGAKHCIYNVLQVFIGEEDEVIIPSPYWVSYPEMVNLANGIIKFIETKIEDGFKLKPNALEKSITKKTKLLILNSPNNPTGSVYTKEELEKIAEVCEKNNIYVLSDEIYEKLIYDDSKYVSIGSFNKKIQELTITVNGVSKTYAMTGWRIGYMGAPIDIANAVAKLQDHSTSNPVSISQKAALSALTTRSDWVGKSRQEFKLRRDYIVERVKNIKNLSFIYPVGAFYLFCNISKLKVSSEEFADKFLEESLVAAIPGKSFGRDDFVRFSFAASIPELKKGMDRLEEFVK